MDSPVILVSDTPEIIISLIIFIIFILFLGGMLYLLISSNFQTTTPSNPVISDSRSSTTITCLPGTCATNLFSGFKTCPVNDVSISINPTESVCNSRFLCDNPLTPYALQSDQSTNIDGICEPGVECSCLNFSQCPNYILSVFTTSNGNPYDSLSGQRISFPQKSSFVSSSGFQSDSPPIQFTNPSTTFCAAPLSFLPLSNPGCNFVSTANNNSMDINDLLLCMGQAKGCSGIISNPCLQGTLAILTSNPDLITSKNIINDQFACVRGEPCPCGQVSIFDTNYGGIVCRTLS